MTVQSYSAIHILKHLHTLFVVYLSAMTMSEVVDHSNIDNELTFLRLWQNCGQIISIFLFAKCISFNITSLLFYKAFHWLPANLLVEKPVHEHVFNYTNMLPNYVFGVALRHIYCYLLLPKRQTRIYGKAAYMDSTENLAE